MVGFLAGANPTEEGDDAREEGDAMPRYLPLRLARWFSLAALAALLLVGCAATSPHLASATATPTTEPGPAGQLAASVRRALGVRVTQVTAAYDAAKESATITIIVGGMVPSTDAQIAAAYTRVKSVCYQAFRALWASGVTLREATALVEGPIQDEYADIITDWYGVAVVDSATAQRVDWASETPAAAWSRYNQSMLRSSFTLFD